MWFKNIQLFRLTEKFTLSATELHEKLQAHQLRECGKTQNFSMGWCPPVDGDEAFFTHAHDHCLMLCLGRTERILPQSVVREAVNEKIKSIKETEDRDIFAKEKACLRDETLFELLPRAFTKTSKCYAYIDTQNDWLIVDAASHKKAEELVALLRDSLGSLKCEMLQPEHKPHTILSRWLLEHHCPAPFLIEDCCELIDVKKGVGSIRCAQQDLSLPEITNHIRAGKQATSLALSWAGKLYFSLNDDLSIKRIKPLDIIEERLKDEIIETAYEKQAADFAMMTAEFRQLLTELFQVFQIQLTDKQESVEAIPAE